MYKNFRVFVMSIVSMLAMGMFVACDDDNIDDLTATLWESTWVSEDGTVYSFYKTFNGVTYADREDYDQKKIDESFIWSSSSNKDQLTICVVGYRQEDGEWFDIDNDDYQFTTYDVESYSKSELVLSSGEGSLVLTSISK